MPATTGVIIAILIAFVLELVNGVPLINVETPEHLNALYNMGAIVGGMFHAGSPAYGQYWRLFAAMFLHIGLLHLALNVWALYQLGFLLEVMFGSWRFLVTYFASGLAASIASAMFTQSNGLSAGASGAIFGILGALIFAIRRSPVWRHQQWTKGLVRQLVFWAAINIVIGRAIPGIDNYAHVGGFLVGLILGFLPHRVPPPPPGAMVIDATPE